MTSKILLSTGIFPWMTYSKIIRIAASFGLDGVELVPTRAVMDEFSKQKITHLMIKGLHQSWRLDIGHDKSYGISKKTSVFYTVLRLLFFPTAARSTSFLASVSKLLSLPVTVHDITAFWTKDKDGIEFAGGLLYEIFGPKAHKPAVLKSWLKNKHHGVIFDTRDDQSLLYAKHHGFSNWRVFWEWVGLENVKNIQVTLIGRQGIRNILSHQKTLIEEQLLWLHLQKWKGTVTLEINPFSVLIESRGKMKQPMRKIVEFVRTTIDEGKTWS